MKRPLLAASLFLLAVAAGPCGESTTDTIAGTGTISQGVGPECPNIWHVRPDAGGQILWPVENATFQKEGMQVRFTARARPDKASICMAGTIVDFLTMEAK